jgi:Rad3-related DNA helicase
MTEVMAQQFKARPGNYLAFFNRHNYLLDMAEHFERLHPDITVFKQSRGMSEEAQHAFLQRMTPTRASSLVGSLLDAVYERRSVPLAVRSAVP